MAGGIVGLEADRAVEPEFEAEVGDLEFHLRFGSAREDADERWLAVLQDFEINGAGGSGLNTGAAMVEDAAKFRGPTGDGEVGFGVLKDVRAADLPSADLALDAAAKGCRVKRATVEKNGSDGWEVAQEIGQIVGDGAVGGVGQTPFLERSFGLGGAGVGGAFGVEAVEQDGQNLVAGDAG